MSPTSDHLTTEEIEDLILNARSPEARLWIAILYDTGIRKEALIDLRLEDLDLDTLRPRIIVTQEAVSDDNIISLYVSPWDGGWTGHHNYHDAGGPRGTGPP